MLTYNSVLTTDQASKVRNYLISKWTTLSIVKRTVEGVNILQGGPLSSHLVSL